MWAIRQGYKKKTLSKEESKINQTQFKEILGGNIKNKSIFKDEKAVD